MLKKPNVAVSRPGSLDSCFCENKTRFLFFSQMLRCLPVPGTESPDIISQILEGFSPRSIEFAMFLCLPQNSIFVLLVHAHSLHWRLPCMCLGLNDQGLEHASHGFSVCACTHAHAWMWRLGVNSSSLLPYWGRICLADCAIPCTLS